MTFALEDDVPITRGELSSMCSRPEPTIRVISRRARQMATFSLTLSPYGLRIVEQRFPRRAYVVIRDNPMKPRARRVTLAAAVVLASLGCRSADEQDPLSPIELALAREAALEPPQYVLRTGCRYLEHEKSFLIDLILENAGKKPRACYFGDVFRIEIGPEPGGKKHVLQGIESPHNPRGGPRHVMRPGRFGGVRLVRMENIEGMTGTLILKAESSIWDEVTQRRIELRAEPIECRVEASQ
jgi:hypothetical protein